MSVYFSTPEKKNCFRDYDELIMHLSDVVSKVKKFVNNK